MKRIPLIVAALFLITSFAIAGPPAMPPSSGVSGVVTASDCSSYTALGQLCQDTDDGKLYKGTGAAVEEVQPYSAVLGGFAGVSPTGPCVWYVNSEGTYLCATSVNLLPDDSAAHVKDNTDATKLLQWVLDDFTAGNTRQIKPPDKNCTLSATDDLHTYTESFVVKSPVDADDFLLMKAQAAMTITALNCVAQGSTPSITVAIQECDGNGANCADGGISLTADGSNDADTSFTDAAIDSGDWLKVILGTPTGTVTFISCTLTYTRVR